MKPNFGDSEQSGLGTHQPDSLTPFMQDQTAIKKEVLQEDTQQLELLSLVLPGMCTPEPLQANTTKEQRLSESKHGFSHASGQNIDLRSSQDPVILTPSVEMQSLQSPGEIKPDDKPEEGPPPLSPASLKAPIFDVEQSPIDPITESKVAVEEQLIQPTAAPPYDFSRLTADSLPELELSSQQKTGLLALYHQETQRFSWLKWCRLEQLLENRLHSLLLARQDMETKILPDCRSRYSRIRPHERALLLSTLWGRRKAYGASEFVKGVSTGSLGMVHYFVTAMLVYRFVIWGQSGRLSFDEFQAIFGDSSQKGIDSLVRTLAKLNPAGLKAILTLPASLGVTYLALELAFTKKVSPAILAKHVAHLDQYLQIHQQGVSYWRTLWIDGVRESIPVILQLLSVSYKIEELEKWLAWDGALEPQARWQAFEKIRNVAKKGHKIPQWTAMQSLANLAQGISFSDFARLQRAGYSQDTLKILLKIKATALADLIDLRKQSHASLQRNNLQTGGCYRIAAAYRRLVSWPRQTYASYLLWTIGQARSWRRQRIPFTLLRAVILSLELYFLQKIYQSVIDALRCPDRPGFRFGEGFEPWASDYTVDCFTTRIRLFRTLYPNESVANLVSEISQYYLKDLSALDLRGKYLTGDDAFKIVQAVVAQGATRLQHLDLSDNRLSILPAGVFQGLDSLEELHLPNNNLSTLPADVFQGLDSLNWLNLYNNNLSVLSTGVFQGLDSLGSLDLSNSNLSALSTGVFQGLNSLHDLNLHNNNLSTLPADVFQGLDSLDMVDLSSNQLSTLPERVFQGLDSLYSLDLSKNSLSTLPTRVLQGLDYLRVLDLSNNNLSTLPAGVLQGLDYLWALDLSGNQLNSFAVDTLPSILHLHSLSIGGNPFIPNLLNRSFLQTLPINLTILTTLDLSGSSLANITEGTFEDLRSLENLGLSNNRLSTLSNGTFQNLTILRSLDLSDNALSALPADVFQGLDSLKWLDLSSNQLSTLPAGVFQELDSLKVLYLFSNQLNTLPTGMFEGLSSLESLSLIDNQLNTLPAGVFQGLDSLDLLDLSSNQLSTLPAGVFQELDSLKVLYLFSNQLNTLPTGVFEGLSSLESLGLIDNQLNTLPAGVFQGLDSLRTLNLSSNQLGTLPTGVFQGLDSLDLLDLSSNQLSTLPAGVFQELDSLSGLALDHNLLTDESIESITQAFLYRTNYLNLSYNSIGNNGMATLAKMLPCTHIHSLDLSGNSANNTSVMLALQSKILKRKCEDQLCHASLPPTAACDTSSNPSAAKATAFDVETADWLEIKPERSWLEAGDDSDWGEKSHQETLTETSDNLFRYDFWPSTVDSSSEATPALLAPITASETTSSSITIATTSAMLLGVTGLGILLFKSTWIRTLAKHGSHYGSQVCQGVVNLTTRVAAATGSSISPRSFFSAATPSSKVSRLTLRDGSSASHCVLS